MTAQPADPHAPIPALDVQELAMAGCKAGDENGVCLCERERSEGGEVGPVCESAMSFTKAILAHIEGTNT